jgi:hypothetical protein
VTSTPEEPGADVPAAPGSEPSRGSCGLIALLVAGLVLGLGVIDLMPLITRSGRESRFLNAAKPGDPWADARAKLHAAGFSFPEYPGAIVYFVPIDKRTPWLMKAAYAVTPAFLAHYLPHYLPGSRQGYVTVNPLGEVHESKVLRPGTLFSYPPLPTTGTRTRLVLPPTSTTSTQIVLPLTIRPGP